MANEDTVSLEFYAPWPLFGKKLSEQLGEIRTDTATLAPIVRGFGLDASGDFSTLDAIESTAVQAIEIGEQNFHNRFRMHYNKTTDVFELASNTGTTEVPNWYTTWWIDKDGLVTQQNTPTTASNLASGNNIEGFFKQKSGVNLEFKSLQVFYPLSLNNTGSLVRLRTGAEANTYSNLTPNVALGGPGDIVSILADSGKQSLDFPFKSIEAGPNMTVTAASDGQTVVIQSTAQVVEFYGITLKHHDDSFVRRGTHMVAFHTDNFYLSPSSRTNESLVNLIDRYVDKDGDTMRGQLLMHPGTAAAPAIAFALETDTGLRRRAANDFAFVTSGVDRLRIQDSLIFGTVPFHVADSTVALPGYTFSSDPNTGLYQKVAGDDSLSIATGGSEVGRFSASGFETNRVTAGFGTFYVQVLGHSGIIPGRPAYSFIGDPDTGMYHNTTNSIGFASNGIRGFRLSNVQELICDNQIYVADGTSSLPSFAFDNERDTGMYSSADNELSFSVNTTRVAFFDDSDTFHPTGQIISHEVDSSSTPAYSFFGETGKGMYDKTSEQIGWTWAAGSICGHWQRSNLIVGPSSSEGTIRLANGSAGAPSYTFQVANQLDVGMYRSATDQVEFATGAGGRAGYFDGSQDLYVTNHVFLGDGSLSAPAYSFSESGQADVGMYRAATDELGFVTGGIRGMFIDSRQHLRVNNGSATFPAISFEDDVDTGIYQNVDGDGSVAFTTGGTRAGYFDSGQDLYVTNDLRSGRVEAGIGVFYTSLLADELTVVGDVVSKGTSWTSRTSAGDNNWSFVTYGNGLFVAVSNTAGVGNQIMTSPDGVNWTSRTSAADNSWVGVTYGNGLFVAIAQTGSGNHIMTSPDGVNWTSRTSAAGTQWQSVTYGNGIFVAVSQTGTGNRVMTSPDGINWIIRTSAVDNLWRSVIFGNGLFVAVAISNTDPNDRVMTSPDGVNWTSRTSAEDNDWGSVTYGNGLFVAVSTNGSGNRVMTSPDGITWLSRTSAANNSWSGVTYGNGLFVAVASGATGDGVMTSPDGINWTIRTDVVDRNWQDVIYGNGMFVAVATTGTGDRVMTSGKTEFNEVSTDNILQGDLEIRNDLVVVGDVRSSRVEAGFGVFYASLTVEDSIDVTGPGTFTGIVRAEAFYLAENAGISIDSGGNLQLDAGSNAVVIPNNVGIGTTSPTDTLHVQSSSGGVTFDATTNDRQIKFNPSAGSMDSQNAAFHINRSSGLDVAVGFSAASFLRIGQSTPFTAPSLLYLGNTVASDLVFVLDGASSQTADLLQIRSNGSTSGADIFVVEAGGNVGIGTTAPSALLHVSGVVRAEAFYLATGSATKPAIRFNNDLNTGIYQNASGDNSIAFTTAGTQAGYFDANQNLFVTGDVRSSRVEAGIGTFYTTIFVGQYHSSTNDVNISSTNDTDTGIGFRNASVDLVVGGSRITSVGAGGLVANKFLSLSTGTESAPMFTYNSDNDTGMYFPVANELAFTTGGTRAGFFDAQQNLHVTNGILAGGVVRGEAFYLGVHNSGISIDSSSNLQLDAGGNDIVNTGKITTKNSTSATDIAIGNDSNTGFSLRGTGTISINIGGANTGFFNSGSLGFPRFRASSSSLAAPAFQSAFDTNTGIHFPTGDILSFSTGGVEAGFFDANQNFYVTGNIQAERFIRPNSRKYTTTDINVDRVLDGADALAVVTDVLGTLIDDLKEVGIIG